MRIKKRDVSLEFGSSHVIGKAVDQKMRLEFLKVESGRWPELSFSKPGREGSFAKRARFRLKRKMTGPSR